MEEGRKFKIKQKPEIKNMEVFILLTTKEVKWVTWVIKVKLVIEVTCDLYDQYDFI